MVYNVGKANKSVLPSAKKIAVVGSKPLGKTLSKNSIRNPNENVKKNDSAKSDTVKLSARKGETTEKALSHFGRTYSCSTGDGSVCSYHLHTPLKVKCTQQRPFVKLFKHYIKKGSVEADCQRPQSLNSIYFA